MVIFLVPFELFSSSFLAICIKEYSILLAGVMQCKYSLWYVSLKSWLDTWNSYLSVGLKSHNLQAFRGESVLEKKQYIQIIEGSYNFSSGTSWQCAVSSKKNKVGVSRYSLSRDEPWHTVQQELTLHYVGRSHCLVPAPSESLYLQTMLLEVIN